MRLELEPLAALRFSEDENTIKRLGRVIELMKIGIEFDRAREICDETIEADEQVFMYILNTNERIMNLKREIKILEDPLCLKL